jgi:hypothetical protein
MLEWPGGDAGIKSMNLNLTADITADMLGTGYSKFAHSSGIEGLCKSNGDRLDILALHADVPGTGQFRVFIGEAKKTYRTICIWEIWNTWLEPVLDRYGFSPETEITSWGESVSGMRWDKMIRMKQFKTVRSMVKHYIPDHLPAYDATGKFRCDVCGRFISNADLDSGKAIRQCISLDSEHSTEDYETLCQKHKP